jgi:hypothetical protein
MDVIQIDRHGRITTVRLGYAAKRVATYRAGRGDCPYFDEEFRQAHDELATGQVCLTAFHEYR